MSDFLPSHTLATASTFAALYFAFVDGKLVLVDGRAPELTQTAAAPMLQAASSLHYLGRWRDLDCWALTLEVAPEGMQAHPLRFAIFSLEQPFAELASRAAQIVEWDRTHRHCGVCAAPTLPKSGERARVCSQCEHVAYPRVSPAMMALVLREGQMLLGRSAQFPPGMYSALAGFVEPGESLEDCVRREVREEVGVEVNGLRYWGSQSWPFPHSLMLAFTANWTGGEIVPQAGEIEDAQWFSIDSLPKIPPVVSIAGRLIRATLAEMRAA